MSGNEPALVRDWVGRLVVMRRNVQLRGGGTVLKGTLLRVCSVWRGKLTLEDPDAQGQVVPAVARHLHRGYVRMLPEECTGHGRCHGCLAWCAACGDVDTVCDDLSCDQHAHVHYPEPDEGSDY